MTDPLIDRQDRLIAQTSDVLDALDGLIRRIESMTTYERRNVDDFADRVDHLMSDLDKFTAYIVGLFAERESSTGNGATP